MPSFLRDLRLAGRVLAKKPGFTALVVFTLALGIGSTSAVFSLVQGVLLTPPPYARPDSIVLITPAKADGEPHARPCTTAEWTEWRKSAKSFEAIAGYSWGFQFLELPDRSESIRFLRVTPEYFRVIGVKPLLGREFAESDIVTPEVQATTIIIGYEFWKRRFNGDPGIVGKPLRLSRYKVPLTIVGVMPPDMRFLPSPGNAAEPNYDVDGKVDCWVPYETADLAKPKQGYCDVVGRLGDGVTLAQAQAELTAITARQARANSDFEGITAKVQPLLGELNRNGRRLLFPLMGAVALVFLIACGNVAGLLLARGLQRQHEYAVRCALGARRGQIFGQVLAESSMLAGVGGVLGIGLAIAIVQMLKGIGGLSIPRLDQVGVGWPVLAFCFGSAMIAAVLAGVIPALRASRMYPADALKGTRTSGVGKGERRLLGGMAVVQTALTLALLVGAGLLIRTVSNLAGVSPGYETQNVLTMSVTMPEWSRYADFHSRALAELVTLPGIRKAAFAWGVPLTGNNWINRVVIEGQGDSAKLKDELLIPSRAVTTDYFDALGIRVVRGRGFQATDAWIGPNAVTNSPFVCVVNEALVAKFFEKGDPIGRKVRFPQASRQAAEIVGVIANTRTDALSQGAAPEIYLSMWQFTPFTKHLVIQTSSDPANVIGAVQRRLREIDPTAAIEQVKTLTAIRDDSIGAQTFAMRMLVGFSLVGSALALIGIYGVLSLSVGSRKRDIAIRMAVGAQRRDVLGLVLSEGLKLIGAGLVIGTGVAIGLARLLRAFLFGVERTDPLTFASAALLFTAVALLACYSPARRAAGVDPMNALRYE